MDHPLSFRYTGPAFFRAWLFATLLSLLNNSVSAQTLSGLTARQSGTSIVLELESTSVEVENLRFFYSVEGGNSWISIPTTCLISVSPKSVEWNVLECLDVETFSGQNIRFKVLVQSACIGTIRYDYYDYRIIEIGDQCWFAENLRTTIYSNGDLIPGNLSDSLWVSLSSGAKAVCAATAPYGRLYNWYAVDDSRGLCPRGWHVPGEDEWHRLEMELGITSSPTYERGWVGIDQGARLKASHSDYPSWDGTNDTDFSALPSGARGSSSGEYFSIGTLGYWWSASSYGVNKAWSRKLTSGRASIGRDVYDQRYGFSVRCLRDY